jgi:hypothetical protein
VKHPRTQRDGTQPHCSLAKERIEGPLQGLFDKENGGERRIAGDGPKTTALEDWGFGIGFRRWTIDYCQPVVAGTPEEEFGVGNTVRPPIKPAPQKTPTPLNGGAAFLVAGTHTFLHLQLLNAWLNSESVNSGGSGRLRFYVKVSITTAFSALVKDPKISYPDILVQPATLRW